MHRGARCRRLLAGRGAGVRGGDTKYAPWETGRSDTGPLPGVDARRVACVDRVHVVPFACARPVAPGRLAVAVRNTDFTVVHDGRAVPWYAQEGDRERERDTA